MDYTPISLLTDFFGGHENRNIVKSTTTPISIIETAINSNKENEISDDSTVSLSLEEDTDSRTIDTQEDSYLTDSRTVDTLEKSPRVETQENTPNKSIGSVLDDSFGQVENVMDSVYDHVVSICSFISGDSKSNEERPKNMDDNERKLIGKRVSFNLTPTFSEDANFDDEDEEQEDNDDDDDEKKDDPILEGHIKRHLGIQNQNESPKRIQNTFASNALKNESHDKGIDIISVPPMYRESLARNSSISSLRTVKANNTNGTLKTTEVSENKNSTSNLEDDSSIEQAKRIIQNRIQRRRQFEKFDDEIKISTLEDDTSIKQTKNIMQRRIERRQQLNYFDDNNEMPFDEAFYPPSDRSKANTESDHHGSPETKDYDKLMNKNKDESVIKAALKKEDKVDTFLERKDPSYEDIYPSRSLGNSIHNHVDSSSLTTKKKVYEEEITQDSSSNRHIQTNKPLNNIPDSDQVMTPLTYRSKASIYDERRFNFSPALKTEEFDNLRNNESFENRSQSSKQNVSSSPSSLSSNLTRERMKKMQERKKRDRRSKEAQMKSDNAAS